LTIKIIEKKAEGRKKKKKGLGIREAAIVSIQYRGSKGDGKEFLYGKAKIDRGNFMDKGLDSGGLCWKAKRG